MPQLLSISDMSPRIFIITGEPSGDLHGSNLVKAIKALNPDAEIACWGGDKMASAGARVVKHIDDLAFMGFVEVAANLRTILKNFKLCKQHIEEFKPDLVVHIDYPGFNLRIAKTMTELGIENVYYISPQIWAWKESRVKKVKKWLKHVFVILPFEKQFYEKHGVEAEFVGHPLLDEVEAIQVDQHEFRLKHGLDSSKAIVALLPGSRTQEINLLLPEFRAVVKAFPEYQFVVSKVPWQSRDLYDRLSENAAVLEGNTYDLIAHAEAAIVTSGTATLETALIGTPQVVVYKANPISVMIARFLVRVKYISLVNLVMDREVVTELIQKDVNAKSLVNELSKILEGGSSRADVLKEYLDLKHRLGDKGASDLVANRLLKIIANTNTSPE